MRRRLSFLAGLTLLAVVGCGGGDKVVPVEGTVTKHGAPITFGDSEGVTITLTSGSSTYTTNVDEKGGFTVQRPEGGGIPAGKYKVKYVHYQNASPYSKAKPFRNEKQLPEEWDVSGSGNKYTIAIDTK
jgi:hypothetical protein